MKIGDKIAYICFSKSFVDISSVGWGYIYDINDKAIGIGRFGNGTQIISKNDENCIYCPINSSNHEKVREYFLEIIDEHIEKQKSLIRKLTSEEKDELVKNKFNQIKTQINATAKSMIEAEDESKFINCLKEICQLKIKLFTIKIKDLDNIHKQNGAVKWKIRQLEEFRERVEKINFTDLD